MLEIIVSSLDKGNCRRYERFYLLAPEVKDITLEDGTRVGSLIALKPEQMDKVQSCSILAYRDVVGASHYVIPYEHLYEDKDLIAINPILSHMIELVGRYSPGEEQKFEYKNGELIFKHKKLPETKELFSEFLMWARIWEIAQKKILAINPRVYEVKKNNTFGLGCIEGYTTKDYWTVFKLKFPEQFFQTILSSCRKAAKQAKKGSSLEKPTKKDEPQQGAEESPKENNPQQGAEEKSLTEKAQEAQPQQGAEEQASREIPDSTLQKESASQQEVEPQKARQVDESKEEPSLGEEKKETQEVAEASQKKDGEKHGGDHVSQEVEESPNRSTMKQLQKRLGELPHIPQNRRDFRNRTRPSRSRNGIPKENKKETDATEPLRAGNRARKRLLRKIEEGVNLQKLRAEELKSLLDSLSGKEQKGGISNKLFLPETDRKPSPRERIEMQSIASSFSRMIGMKSKQKTLGGIRMDIPRVLMELEYGGNPIPYLRVTRDNAQRVKVLISPDMSGSCLAWTPMSLMVSKELEPIAKSFDADLFVIPNANGILRLPNGDIQGDNAEGYTEKVVSQADIVVYLGDEDALSWRDWVLEKNIGATLIYISNHGCSKLGTPTIKSITRKGQTCVVHIVGVRNSVKEYAAVLRHLTEKGVI